MQFYSSHEDFQQFASAGLSVNSIPVRSSITLILPPTGLSLISNSVFRALKAPDLQVNVIHSGSKTLTNSMDV